MSVILLRLKHIIIIPGTCAHWSNWFDQINDYERLGHKVDFLELDTYKFKTFIECTSNMFDKIASIIAPENQEVSFPSDKEFIIIGHSMGAMIMLKILSERKFFSNRNLLAYDQFCKSKLIFVQVPLKVNLVNVRVLSSLKYLAYPFFLFHRYLIFPWLTYLLLFFKVIEKKLISKIPIFRELSNFIFNALIMHNAFWGTRIKEFAHSNEYYKHWDAFALQGLTAPKDISKFERATYGFSESTQSNISSNYSNNYYFTYGFPDFFCGSEEIIGFAKEIGANAVKFTPNNHLPHHMFWNQKRFNDMVLSSKKEEAVFYDVY